MVLVGRIARPHGIKGQVIVNPETDFVEDRFAEGAELRARTGNEIEVLRVTSMRIQGGRPVVGFAGFDRIDDVERLAGLELRIAEEALRPLDAGTYYQHQLVGCVVEAVSGKLIGEVTRVDEGAGGSLLVVGGPGGEILIPFAIDICVEIDIASRRIRIDPPEGLLELNQGGSASRNPPHTSV
jgi:16S rRNA processing protein RimM